MRTQLTDGLSLQGTRGPDWYAREEPYIILGGSCAVFGRFLMDSMESKMSAYIDFYRERKNVELRLVAPVIVITNFEDASRTTVAKVMYTFKRKRPLTSTTENESEVQLKENAPERPQNSTCISIFLYHWN
ncbi:hypothetical protein NPIL_567061 [Nephila pilipes]|uniref:Uncharacterized protein n=1 Tax=Nephila pilipes TaxID=299642 RepID=A0A8X6NZX9_NEPPI|nr:hypothetical protein NPIL_567061 [Nephila pilipes]